MNESSLHLRLVKLYLLYFEAANKFEDTKGKASYQRSKRYLLQIEKICKKRRAEIRETYRNTEYYKNIHRPIIDRKIKELRANYDEDKNKKD